MHTHTLPHCHTHCHTLPHTHAHTAKIQTSAFVFDHLLPRTKSHRATMFTPIDSVMGLKTEHFSFDY